mgnify:CR=1 FL=1
MAEASYSNLILRMTRTFDAAPERARIIFPAGPPAPGRDVAGIEIDVVAGYGDAPESAPAPLRQAITAGRKNSAVGSALLVSST